MYISKTIIFKIMKTISYKETKKSAKFRQKLAFFAKKRLSKPVTSKQNLLNRNLDFVYLQFSVTRTMSYVTCNIGDYVTNRQKEQKCEVKRFQRHESHQLSTQIKIQAHLFFNKKAKDSCQNPGIFIEKIRQRKKYS